MRYRKILIHTPDFPSWDGGISTMAYEYARELSAMGFDVHVVTLFRSCEDSAWDRAQPFNVHRLRNIKSSFVSYFYQLYKTFLIISKFKPDLFISLRWDFSGLVGSVLKRSGNYRLLQFFHGNDIFGRHRKNFFWENRFLASIKKTDYVVSVSRFTDQLLKSTLPFDIDSHVNNLGVDIVKFTPANEVSDIKNELGFGDRKIILSLSRLVKRKGHEEVIKTIPDLIKKIPNLLYVVAGKGPYEQELRKLVGSLNVSEFVNFVGFVSEAEKVKYYQACDVYVMLSETDVSSGDIEGFGLTHLEANACGKPVIAKRQGGVVDVIVEGSNGMFVDSEGELFDFLSSLLIDKALYTKLSKSSLTYAVEEFNWSASVEGLLKKIDSRQVSTI